MNYTYHVRKIDWGDQKDFDDWQGDGLTLGTKNSMVVTEIIDGTNYAEFFLGDAFFNMNHRECSIGDRVIKWIRANKPELMI